MDLIEDFVEESKAHPLRLVGLASLVGGLIWLAFKINAQDQKVISDWYENALAKGEITQEQYDAFRSGKDHGL